VHSNHRRPIVYAGATCICLLISVLLSWTAREHDFDAVFFRYKVSFVWGAIALFGWEIKQRLDARASVIPLLGGALVVLATQAVMSRLIPRTFDYEAYGRAADAIAAGTDPYVHQKGRYLYPPLLAESVYLLRGAVDKVAGSMGPPLKKADTGDKQHVTPFFRLWSGAQIVAAVLIYALGYRLARRLGADRFLASALPLGLLLANHAYWRTLENGQINLALAVVFLVAILCAARRPLISGLAVAFGTHLKVYPGFLLGPWALSGRWRVTAYALLWFALIYGLQVALFGPSLWKQYLHFASEAPQQVRDECIATIAVVSFTFGGGRPIAFGKSWTLAAYVAAAAYAAILSVMAWRFAEREWIWRKQRRELDDSAVATVEEKFRIMGHANDAVVLPLLISPIVWNHHYVVLIPVLIWSTVLLGSDRLESWLPIAAILSPFFGRPFIYIYYFGVWLWIYQTSPQAIWKAVTPAAPAPAARQAPDGLL
jgi:hypothetical protein